MHNHPTLAAGNIATSTWIYRLNSIVEPLPLAQLFPRSQPLEVELGCGDGTFMIAYARSNPDRNFIGIERLLGRIRKCDRKSIRAQLTNVRWLRIEAGYALRYLLPPGSVIALHVYFPDPWPKRRHHPRRLVNASFMEAAQQALAPGGRLYLRTDDADYFAQIKSVAAAHPAFQAVELPASLAGIITDFERGFLEQGTPIMRAAYETRSHTVFK